MNTKHGGGIFMILWAALLPAGQGAAEAQEPFPRRVDLAFNRFYDYAALTDALHRLAETYPDLMQLTSIGKSVEGRELWMVTINNPKTGSDRDKPAMYIDGNVHGNEVQASEVCLYTIWYLTHSYGHVDKLTRLIDRNAFYILPSVNPDGRDHWFHAPNTPNSSRSGKAPVDEDHDGLLDEDDDDDLDGDGSITSMWKADPDGRWRRSQRDPRIFEPVARDEKGEYTNLGSEGIDNDADGQINEDGVGGYDMNRNWPCDWQPEYIQYGAGEYPFSYPETAAIGAFILDHPNIAAVQSYHNAGGMILRGPGMRYREPYYPPQDLEVYDEIGRTGERILPFYRYLVVWKDLYEVHGGFVTWTSENLGIFSFTNELWTNEQYYAGKEGDWARRDARMKFGDLLEFGTNFTDYRPFVHPTFGEILVGGWKKYAFRVPPTFMLEELCHRNFAFTMYHAEQMPRLSIPRYEVVELTGGVWRVTAQVTNEGAIPTISAVAAQRRIGARDRARLTPAADGATGPDAPRVLASGTVGAWTDVAMRLMEKQPDTIWVESGIAGRGYSLFRWIVAGQGSVRIEYTSQKGGRVHRDIPLTPNLPSPAGAGGETAGKEK